MNPSNILSPPNYKKYANFTTIWYCLAQPCLDLPFVDFGFDGFSFVNPSFRNTQSGLHKVLFLDAVLERNVTF